MPFLDLDAGRIEYRRIPATRAGAPPLVLLHEGLGSVGQWRDFPDRLAAQSGCETIVYSRRGHGRSAPLAGPRGVDYMHVEALAVLPEIRARLEIRHPVLVGHSDGASIALIHAAAQPAAVAGLALIAPHVFVEQDTLAGIRAATEAFRSGEIRGRLARHHDDVDRMFHGWSEIWLSPEFAQWNIEDCLPPIAAPILLIQQEDDPYGTLAQLAAIRARVSSASVAELVLPGRGHTPFRDHPERVSQAIAGFVSGLAGAQEGSSSLSQ